MNIPDPLTRNADYLHLYLAATLGCTDAERKCIDTLISLAFTGGEASGMDKAAAILVVKTP